MVSVSYFRLHCTLTRLVGLIPLRFLAEFTNIGSLFHDHERSVILLNNTSNVFHGFAAEGSEGNQGIPPACEENRCQRYVYRGSIDWLIDWLAGWLNARIKMFIFLDVWFHVFLLSSFVVVKIKKNKTNVKFKIRCSRFLYTLKLDDKEKADKLRASLPPGEQTRYCCRKGAFFIPVSAYFVSWIYFLLQVFK